MLKNHVNGCYGNHAMFHSVIEYIFEDKKSLRFCGSNDLAFMKHCPREYKVGQLSFRCF